MPSILERFLGRSGEPTPLGSGSSATEVVDRLERGEPPSAILNDCGLRPAELIAAIAWAALGADDGNGPPLVQRPPRRPKLVTAITEPTLAELFPRARRPDRLALSAGLLQMLDAWDASHSAAQEADDLGERRSSTYWHGIAHRREPDPGNASYWFRRVGRHPIFDELAEAARPVLESFEDPSLTNRLVGSGWDPLAFIDAVSSTKPGDSAAGALRHVQRLEMDRLLSHSLEAVES